MNRSPIRCCRYRIAAKSLERTVEPALIDGDDGAVRPFIQMEDMEVCDGGFGGAAEDL